MSAGRVRHRRPEWPTIVVAVGCYIIWSLAVIWHDLLGWLWVAPATLAVALHASLQHEVLHGHPTPSPIVNRALVFPALGLFIPYHRYRILHLRHHWDECLTDPHDDPESWYLTASDWSRMPTIVRLLLQANATFSGRMLLGPALSLFAFWSSDFALIRQGNHAVIKAWLLHAAGVAPVLIAVASFGIHPLFYCVAVAYPGLSILMIRSFIEHRAAANIAQRTAVIEAGLIMRLLFLNNNLHVIHHRYPSLAWYHLPKRWRAERDSVLKNNDGDYYPGGYIDIARRWLFTRREPIIHPFAHGQDTPALTNQNNSRKSEQGAPADHHWLSPATTTSQDHKPAAIKDACGP